MIGKRFIISVLALVSLLCITMGLAAGAALPSFNPTVTYTTVTDFDGKVYALQNGIYYDQQGNAWLNIPPSKNGYTAVTALAQYPNNSIASPMTWASTPVLAFTTNVNNYSQVSIQNTSSGTNASSDFIAYSNLVTSDASGYMDMGIESSGFAQGAYAVTAPNEGYVFMSAPTGASATGNMVIATDSTGTANNIIFATNGLGNILNRRVWIFGSGRVSIGSSTDNGTDALQVTGSVKASTGYKLTNLLMSSTAPTVTGFGTSPSVVANNGTAAFTINVGTGGAASTGTVTLPTATTGWACVAQDVTTPASNSTAQTGTTTTSASFTNYARTTGLAAAWTASDILVVKCTAY